MFILLVGALVAGVLTTLAPCVLPLLPVIVGGSVAPAAASTGADGLGTARPAGSTVVTQRTPRTPSDRERAVVIAASLGISVAFFTVILKASTALLGVPLEVWAYVSGGILVTLGLVSLFPALWDRMSASAGLQGRSNGLLGRGRAAPGLAGPILTGAALGPVFSSCSPFYAYLVATILPASAGQGMLLLSAYVLGLSGTLLLISLLGQRAVRKLRWSSDPHGWFRRTVGALFIVVGVLVLTGADKDIQTWLVLHNPLERVTIFDQVFIPGG